VKRRLERLEKDRHFLDDLLRALRVAGPSQLNALVDLIRTDAGRQEIETFLSYRFASLGDSDERNRGKGTYRRHRQMIGRIEDVVNPPLQVPKAVDNGYRRRRSHLAPHVSLVHLGASVVALGG